MNRLGVCVSKLLVGLGVSSLLIGMGSYKAPENEGFHWLQDPSGSHVASGIQWNEHYLVTAKHVDFLNKPGATCKIECDLQFVASQEAKASRWRDAENLERVQVVGVVPGEGLVTRKGRVLPWTRTLVEGGMAYQLIEADISKGMSGGPLYGEDGAVVGMIIGFIDPEEVRKRPEYRSMPGIGLFVPTAKIKEQWDLLGLPAEPGAEIAAVK